MDSELLGFQDLVLLKPPYLTDNRGSFHRSYCFDYINKNILTPFEVKQGNISINPSKYTLRGLHLQLPPSQESKLINCITGSVYVVIIDLRPKSKTFLDIKYLSLMSSTGASLFVPPHCAIGWLTLQDNTILHYYMGDIYTPELAMGIRFNDPFFHIDWPEIPLIISQKDQTSNSFDLKDYLAVYNAQ